MSARYTALPMSVWALAGVLLAAQQPSSLPPAVPPGAPPADGQPITTLHAAAHLVVLDVVVRDGSGNLVKGLKQSDFTLTEDGVPQTLVSFTEHDASTGLRTGLPAADQPSLPPNTFAVQRPADTNAGSTVIVLGQLAYGDAPWVLKQIREYLEANAPTTPIAIVKRDAQGVHLVQGLTADRQVLLAALASKRIMPLPPTYLPYRGAQRHFGLERYIAGIKGHVNLIWFSSGGGGERSFPDLMKLMEEPNGETMKVLQLSRVALYPMDATGIGAPGSGVDAPLPGLGGETFHRVYDPPTGNFGKGGGLVLGNSAVSEMAQASGGMSYHLHQGYKQVIAQVVDGGAHYYTISYKPSNTDWNGTFRRIHLDVGAASKSRAKSKQFLDYDPGSDNRVQYRRGYIARDTTPVPGTLTSAARLGASTPH